MPQLIFYSLVGGVFSLVGGFILLTRVNIAKKIITPLLAFAAGAFLGVTFLDILPEAVEQASEPRNIFLALLIGFISFFILERLLMFFHVEKNGHEHSDHTEFLPFMLILGDCIHNFLDGILIALAYLANPLLGLTTALGVAAHEIPQEIGDASVLLSQGWTKKRIILSNILQSLFTVPGVLVGYYTGNILEAYLPYMLASAGGVFLYIAASDLIPEIHHKANHHHFYRVVIPLLASVIIVGYLVEITRV